MDDYRLLVILLGVGAVALAWLLLRFGKQIARALLVAGVMVVVVVVALALLNQAMATRQTAKAATVAATSQAVSSVILALVVGGLGVVTVGALAFAGFWWIRWQMEQKHQAHQMGARRQATLPEQRREPTVTYIERDVVDLSGVDLSQWGW